MTARRINSLLDHLIRPQMHLWGRRWPLYQFCGCIGLTLAVSLSMALVMLRDLSPAVMAAVTLSAVITFLALAFATKLLTGQELLIYYHHEIAVVMTSALVLYLFAQPLRPYLDITILGIGTFLVCGRLGCLMVGCCHGRPHPWGVCYTQAHAEQGFTSYYVGVRLFPIQALEMVWVLGVVLVGIYQVLAGHAPGAVLAWYVIVYDLGRFAFEFLRGDPWRPYYLGFSEAQWISVGLMAVVAAMELAGLLPLAIWHMAATVLLILMLCGLFFYRRWEGTARHRLLSPPHIHQIARALENAAPTGKALDRKHSAHPDQVAIACTNLGLQISAGPLANPAEFSYLVTLSSQTGRLSTRAARDLSRLIAQLKHRSPPARILHSRPGIFHLLFQSRNSGRPV